MSRVDYYRVLNVSKSATIKQIKDAYRKLALRYHPDTCTTDKKVAETIFKSLTDAYHILSNESSKKEYDATIGNFGRSTPTGGSTYDRTSVYTSKIRNPHAHIRRSGVKVSRDRYDVHEWYTQHYQEVNEDTVRGKEWRHTWTPPSGWTDPHNKHQSYYYKRNAREREEKNTGTKWSADSAYESYQSNPSGSKRHSSTHSNASGRNQSGSKADGDKEQTSEEKRIKSATDKLNQSRIDRRNKEAAKGAVNGTGATVEGGKGGSCSIS